ncbi:MAG: hypothetical protein J2P48_24370 [Alphaproteobacteria bacterium]|nr:hypothetical protein [Alphaproteobacteria bacterium]
MLVLEEAPRRRAGDHRMDVAARCAGWGSNNARPPSGQLDSKALPELTVDDLISIGVTSLGHRRKRLAAIAFAPALRSSNRTGPLQPRAEAVNVPDLVLLLPHYPARFYGVARQTACACRLVGGGQSASGGFGAGVAPAPLVTGVHQCAHAPVRLGRARLGAAVGRGRPPRPEPVGLVPRQPAGETGHL